MKSMNQIIKTSSGEMEYRIEGEGDTFILVLNGGHSSRSDSFVEQMNHDQMNEVIHYLSGLRSESGFIQDIQHQSGELCRIQAPTLIVHGCYDKSVPVSHAEYAAGKISKSELMITEAESHLIWFSKYKRQIEQRIIQFLK